MIQTNKKGCKELLTQRMFLAIISSIVVQFSYVSCMILITNLKPDFTTWFRDTWDTITSFRMWGYFFVLASITFLQGIVCSKKYLNTPPYLKSRFSKLHDLFTAQNILLGSLYVTIGGVLVWLHLSLNDKQYTFDNCDKAYGLCFAEERYFLLLSGFWSGLYFFVKMHFENMEYFKFSIVPSSKFLHIRRRIYGMLPSLMIAAIWPTLYFTFGYYFIGSYCKEMMLTLMPTYAEPQPLNSLRLLNPLLMFYLWLYQLIFMLTINSMYMLFEIFLTDWVPFEFQQMTVFEAGNVGVTLPEALSMDEIPIMQHLGYFDLVIIAHRDKMRRNNLFTLSQPGGHPYNWNCIIEKCLSLLKKFNADLNTISSKVKEQKPVTAPVTIPPNVPVFQREYTYHMRNLIVDKEQSHIVSDENLEQRYTEPFIYKFIRNKWENFISYLLSKPLIYYIFGEQEDNKLRHTLFNKQVIIWAVEAISMFCVVSLKEDAYGIAQKDLPAVIDTLLSLKQTFDKLQKSNILVRKQQSDDKLIRQAFSALRNATKRNIYRITTSYQDYISDLALEPATVEQLQSFLNYKE